MEKWFELKIIFFDMIFAFCRSASFVEAQASHSTVIPCGKGGGRRQWPSFTGTVSFGFAVSGSDGSDMHKEILLIRPLIEYETLAEFCNVIVYLSSSLSFAPIFCIPVLS